MNFFLKLFFTDLSCALNKLREFCGLPKTKTKYMSLDTTQEIAVIEAAIALITSLKASVSDAVAALEPLIAENTELKAVVADLNDQDAASDVALEQLAALIAPTPDPEPEPEPTTEEQV